MKKLISAALAALAMTTAAHAGEKPFGYTYGPNGTMLFYKAACGAEGADKQWRVGVLVQPLGPRAGCWHRVVDKQTKDDSVEFCLVGRDNESAPPRLGNACIWGPTDAVMKGNPFPDRAF